MFSRIESPMATQKTRLLKSTRRAAAMSYSVLLMDKRVHIETEVFGLTRFDSVGIGETRACQARRFSTRLTCLAKLAIGLCVDPLSS